MEGRLLGPWGRLGFRGGRRGQVTDRLEPKFNFGRGFCKKKTTGRSNDVNTWLLGAYRRGDVTGHSTERSCLKTTRIVSRIVPKKFERVEPTSKPRYSGGYTECCVCDHKKMEDFLRILVQNESEETTESASFKKLGFEWFIGNKFSIAL